jgi:hypothetical protein
MEEQKTASGTLSLTWMDKNSFFWKRMNRESSVVHGPQVNPNTWNHAISTDSDHKNKGIMRVCQGAFLI